MNLIYLVLYKQAVLYLSISVFCISLMYNDLYCSLMYDIFQGSDSVTECMFVNGQVEVFQSYNSDTHSNSRLRNVSTITHIVTCISTLCVSYGYNCRSNLFGFSQWNYIIAVRLEGLCFYVNTSRRQFVIQHIFGFREFRKTREKKSRKKLYDFRYFAKSFKIINS